MDTNGAVELLKSAAAASAAARLIYLGYVRRFLSLFSWLVLIAASSFLLGLLRQDSPTYFWLYIYLVPVESIVVIFAVRELFALAFRDYPGIRTIGRWAMYGGMLIAAAAAGLIANAFQRTSAHGSRHLFYLEVAQRSVVFSLAVVILTILFFLSRYPLHLGRNTIVSSVLFSVYFLSDAARLLVDSLAPYLINDYVDWTESVVLAACLVAWAFLLEPERVAIPVAAPPSEHEEHLLAQLNSLNQLLSRVARQ